MREKEREKERERERTREKEKDWENIYFPTHVLLAANEFYRLLDHALPDVRLAHGFACFRRNSEAVGVWLDYRIKCLGRVVVVEWRGS